MFEYLAPLQLKDPKRAFGELEREILFFHSHKRCAVCDSEVAWNEAEIHHVVEHSKGGETTFSNGALVHSVCHPKGEAATKAFAEKFFAAKSKKATPKTQPDDDTLGYFWQHKGSRLFLPDGTEIRMSYKKRTISPRWRAIRSHTMAKPTHRRHSSTRSHRPAGMHGAIFGSGSPAIPIGH